MLGSLRSTKGCRCGYEARRRRADWKECRVAGADAWSAADYRVPTPGAATSTNTASGSRRWPRRCLVPSRDQRARPADNVYRSGDGGRLWRIAMLCCPEGATDSERSLRIGVASLGRPEVFRQIKFALSCGGQPVTDEAVQLFGEVLPRDGEWAAFSQVVG